METIKYVEITLRVPVEEDEDHPSAWDWKTLLDTSEDVKIIHYS